MELSRDVNDRPRHLYVLLSNMHASTAITSPTEWSIYANLSQDVKERPRDLYGKRSTFHWPSAGSVLTECGMYTDQSRDVKDRPRDLYCTQAHLHRSMFRMYRRPGNVSIGCADALVMSS